MDLHNQEAWTVAPQDHKASLVLLLLPADHSVPQADLNSKAIAYGKETDYLNAQIAVQGYEDPKDSGKHKITKGI